MSLRLVHEELIANFSKKEMPPKKETLSNINNIHIRKITFTIVKRYLNLIEGIRGIPDRTIVISSLMSFLIEHPHWILNHINFSVVVLFKICEFKLNNLPDADNLLQSVFDIIYNNKLFLDNIFIEEFQKIMKEKNVYLNDSKSILIKNILRFAKDKKEWSNVLVQLFEYIDY